MDARSRLTKRKLPESEVEAAVAVAVAVATTAETDTNIDIGISETFTNRVEALADQELNGYTINGKKWHGMKGVTHVLRNDILNSIRDGVINKESRTELKERVKDLFSTAKDSQAERIARTEMSAAFDQVAIVNYQEVGIQTVDVIGCEDNDIVPGQTFGCNSSNIPIAQAASIEFHPNHTGTIVPSR